VPMYSPLDQAFNNLKQMQWIEYKATLSDNPLAWGGLDLEISRVYQPT
jgi:hypothetical protein